MSNFKRWLLILLTSGLVLFLLAGFLTIMPALAQGLGLSSATRGAPRPARSLLPLAGHDRQTGRRRLG